MYTGKIKFYEYISYMNSAHFVDGTKILSDIKLVSIGKSRQFVIDKLIEHTKKNERFPNELLEDYKASLEINGIYSTENYEFEVEEIESDME